jgi:hypothetical protein
MLDNVFSLADTDTKVEFKRKFRSRLEFESALSFVNPRSIQGNLRETQSQIATTVGGESKGSTMEVVELQEARAHGEIGDIFKMMLKIYKSEEARSMEVSKKGSFELGSISSHFSQMWDNGRQIRQLFSTDAKFLPTSMLAHDTLVGHVSTLELCTEHIDWLCRWVPQFAERLERIKKDDPMDKKMLEMAEMEEVSFAGYIRSWERVRRRDNSIRFEDSSKHA